MGITEAILRYKAAENLIKALNSQRELLMVGKATPADLQQVKDATREYDWATKMVRRHR